MTTTIQVNDTILKQLEETARAMVATGKGILASEESNPTIKKRFNTIHLNAINTN
jgi:fructose-bisphosphate aldolase, class I